MSSFSAVSSLGTALFQRAEKWLPGLTRYRHKEALPITIYTRRIYILPSYFGIGFGILLCVMLLGSLNFNNNAALLLTFLIAGMTIFSTIAAVKNIQGICLSSIQAQPVHAGEQLIIKLYFENLQHEIKSEIQLQIKDQTITFNLSSTGDTITISLPTKQRGLHALGPCTISCTFPFGLFRAWSVLHPDFKTWVYPKPDLMGIPLPLEDSPQETARQQQHYGEEWQGLRAYNSSDAMRHIAWKQSAKHHTLLSKDFKQAQQRMVTLNWHQLAHLHSEARIARLTRWILQAQAKKVAYRLILPRETLTTTISNDQEHYHKCLRALALLPHQF